MEIQQGPSRRVHSPMASACMAAKTTATSEATSQSLGLPCWAHPVGLEPRPETNPPCSAARHHHRHAGGRVLRPGPPEAAFGHHQAGGASGQTGGGKEHPGSPHLSLEQAQSVSNFPASCHTITFFFMQNHVPMWVGPPNVDSHRRGLRSSAPGPGLTSTWPVSRLLGEQLASAAGGSAQADCHLSAVVRGTGPRPACADSLNTRCSGAGDSCQRGGCLVPAHLVLDGSWGAWSGESRLSYQPSPGVQGPHAGSRRSHKEACSLHSGPTRSRRGLGSPPSPCPEGPSLCLAHSCQAAASSLSCPGPGEGGCHHPCFPNGTTRSLKSPPCTPACPCCAHSPSPGPSAFGLVLARHTRLSCAGRGQTGSTSPGPQGHLIQSPLPGNPASFSHSPL